MQYRGKNVCLNGSPGSQLMSSSLISELYLIGLIALLCNTRFRPMWASPQISVIYQLKEVALGYHVMNSANLSFFLVVMLMP